MSKQRNFTSNYKRKLKIDKKLNVGNIINESYKFTRIQSSK